MDPHSFFSGDSSCELRFERADGEWTTHLYRNGRRIAPIFSAHATTIEAIGVPDESLREWLIATGEAVANDPEWNDIACRNRSHAFRHDGKDFEIWTEIRNKASGATVYLDGRELGSTPDVPWPDGIGSDEEDLEAIQQAQWLIQSGFRVVGRA